MGPLTLDFPSYKPALKQTGLSFDALTFLIPLIAGFLTWLASLKASRTPIGTSNPLRKSEARNRIGMAQRVKQRWIDDVLNKSLHGAVLIDLGMQNQPDAVDYPWDILAQIGDGPEQMLLPNTRISTVYDQAHQALLILGEPGSGKSTMLLELTRELLDRAMAPDSIAPVPVVFTLSTWNAYKTEEVKTLDDWLVQEMRRLYSVPPNIGQHFLDHNELGPMLDGLDEVAQDRRGACVQAINQFRTVHMTPVVVSCRAAEYADLKTKLKLDGAIKLQPLTPPQIDRYVGSLPDKAKSQGKYCTERCARSPRIGRIAALAECDDIGS
ncbi:MAG: NACHT domain-containing protein [Anaerolineales bacterium]|nr:NACHT domain-containing protein [Anaerolineales bacterium]